MPSENYRAMNTRWDDLADNKFRLIHRLNRIKITHKPSSTTVEYTTAGGKQASAAGMLVWNDPGHWYRKKFEVNGVTGHSYSKHLTFDAGEGEGPKEHCVTMTAYPIKSLGGTVKKVLFGYLQEVDPNPGDDSHTGEWR